MCYVELTLIKLTHEDLDNLRCQFGTSSWGGTRYLPYVFTEQGVAMLSSVLKSKRAIQVNIQIMRVFTKLREIMLSHKDLALKIEELERKFIDHDKKLVLVFDAIKRLLKVKKAPPDDSYKRTKMGFLVSSARYYFYSGTIFWYPRYKFSLSG